MKSKKKIKNDIAGKLVTFSPCTGTDSCLVCLGQGLSHQYQLQTPTTAHYKDAPLDVEPMPVDLEPTPVDVEPAPVDVEPTPVDVEPRTSTSTANLEANLSATSSTSPLDPLVITSESEIPQLISPSMSSTISESIDLGSDKTGASSRKRSLSELYEDSGSSYSESSYKSAKRALLQEADTEMSFLRTEITSISLEFFTEQNLAHIFVCNICRGVPTDPVETPCYHIYCKNCIFAWLKLQSACPCCRQVTDENDINSIHGASSYLYKSLNIMCENKAKGCNFTGDMESYIAHRVKCANREKRIVRGKGVTKKPLQEVDLAYRRRYRLKDFLPKVSTDIDDFCTETMEDKTDVFFSILINHLDEIDDDRRDLVDKIWKGRDFRKLSVDQCLALRVDCLQSKRHYIRQYKFFHNFQSENPYHPISALNKKELEYMPGNVRYSIEGQSYCESYYHTPVKRTMVSGKQTLEPISITADFDQNVPEVFCPNVAGVRWPYPDCIAKTLQELFPEIKSGLTDVGWSPRDKSILYKAFIKDGADGLGDVSVYKEKSDRPLPDKAFRAAMCIFRVDAIKGDRVVTVFEEPEPNSIRRNRPILEAIADENDRPSAILCMVPLEAERSYLNGKILKVESPLGFMRFELDFYNSMIDEKLDRAEGGLQGSGSSYVCTLCEATRDCVKSSLGQFQITRTYEGTKQIAEYLEINPDKLSDKQLDALAKGVKSVPILKSDAIKKGLDATHADINLGKFFKNLICHEIAQVTSWALTADIKDLVVNAERRLDQHLKVSIGLNPSLMQGGNYARVLFDKEHENDIIALIPGKRADLVRQLLDQFRPLRSVYRARNPIKDMADEVSQFKTKAVSMGAFLIENFHYVAWPNYLHKVIEHTQEIIEHPGGPGTVGGLSGEGNEGGNKVFRQFRRDLSRKCSTESSLVDVLKMHWLYSCRPLQQISKVSLQERSCSWCRSSGHYNTTCKLRQDALPGKTWPYNFSTHCIAHLPGWCSACTQPMRRCYKVTLSFIGWV